MAEHQSPLSLIAEVLGTVLVPALSRSCCSAFPWILVQLFPFEKSFIYYFKQVFSLMIKKALTILLPRVFYLLSSSETPNYNKVLLHLKIISTYKMKVTPTKLNSEWKLQAYSEQETSLMVSFQIKGGLICCFCFVFSLFSFWRRPLYIMSIYFRQQMASLKYTNLTGFFREADEQKKNKTGSLALLDMNNYKANIIKAVQYQ